MRELQLILVATFISVIVGGGLYFLAEGDNIATSYTPSFRTLEAGVNGPTDVLVQRKNYVFRQDVEFHAFWELLHGNAPGTKQPPAVRFANDHVIAVMHGVRSTGGYDIFIRDIIETPQERIIEIVRREPGPDCVVPEALTNPYHIVAVKKSDKPLRAVESVEEYSCG